MSSCETRPHLSIWSYMVKINFWKKFVPLPKGKEDIFINMRYVISESRLEKIFNNFMDSQYDLKYDGPHREFVDKNGKVFGLTIQHQFYYADYPTEYTLNEMFGELTNELLVHYLRERFPNVRIDGIE